MRLGEDVTVIGRQHVCKDSRAPNDLPVDCWNTFEMLLDVNTQPTRGTNCVGMGWNDGGKEEENDRRLVSCVCSGGESR